MRYPRTNAMEIYCAEKSLYILPEQRTVKRMVVDINFSFPRNDYNLLRNWYLISKIDGSLNLLHSFCYDRLTFCSIEICPTKLGPRAHKLRYSSKMERYPLCWFSKISCQEREALCTFPVIHILTSSIRINYINWKKFSARCLQVSTLLLRSMFSTTWMVFLAKVLPLVAVWKQKHNFPGEVPKRRLSPMFYEKQSRFLSSQLYAERKLF